MRHVGGFSCRMQQWCPKPVQAGKPWETAGLVCVAALLTEVHPPCPYLKDGGPQPPKVQAHQIAVRANPPAVRVAGGGRASVGAASAGAGCNARPLQHLHPAVYNGASASACAGMCVRPWLTPQ